MNQDTVVYSFETDGTIRSHDYYGNGALGGFFPFEISETKSFLCGTYRLNGAALSVRFNDGYSDYTLQFDLYDKNTLSANTVEHPNLLEKYDGNLFFYERGYVDDGFSSTPTYFFCLGKRTITSLFSDIKSNDWFYNDVKYVYEKGIMSGTATNVFSPNAATTRAMIVAILYRLEDSPSVTNTSNFVDVSSSQWYANAVKWAAAKKLITGTSATTFSPNASITREQLASILYRYAQYKGYNVSRKADLSGYSDSNKISSYAKDSLAWATQAKLINGVTNTTLAPQGNATRAQVSAILHRFCDGVVK